MPGMTDSEIIQSLGGATAVAKLLGLKTPDGARRVHNWIKRGIPAQIKLDNLSIFVAPQHTVATQQPAYLRGTAKAAAPTEQGATHA